MNDCVSPVQAGRMLVQTFAPAVQLLTQRLRPPLLFPWKNRKLDPVPTDLNERLRIAGPGGTNASPDISPSRAIAHAAAQTTAVIPLEEPQTRSSSYRSE